MTDLDQILIELKARLRRAELIRWTTLTVSFLVLVLLLIVLWP